jgi:HNH endonuclease
VVILVLGNVLIKNSIMKCIFCDKDFSSSPIEHIVPESLGNIWYTLPANTICGICNNDFSEFEGKAIFKTFLGFIRSKNGIKTKKGIPSKFEIGNIKGVGDDNFKKDVITIDGLEEKDVSNYNPKDGSFQVTIPEFHKSEAATAKMLLKIGYEAIYKSQKKILLKHDFSNLINYVTKIENKDWPFIAARNDYNSFQSIPTFTDKNNLNRIKCKLRFSEISNQILLFHFKYDYINLTINLLNRDISWTDIYFEEDINASLYPKHFKKS